MKTIAEALGEILPAFVPRGAVRLSLLEAQGLVLAERLEARGDLPAFDNSAMDGYAVRARELVGATNERAVLVPLAGESRAGGAMPAPLAAGTCMRIFTGAPMPEGADAVVMQEDTSRDGERVAFRLAPAVGAHVRARGNDLRRGATLLTPGTVLGPGELGLAASQGIASLSVHRRPRVALLSTGDELRDVGDPEMPGTIINSNAYALAAQVHEAGGEPWVLPIAPDVRDAIAERIHEGLTADVLVSCGGVSVGDYDLVKEAFESVGVTQGFWKVAMKPGKPLSFGIAKNGVPVVGLPGNPVSAMVTFEVFVRPGLRRMLGDPAPFRPTAVVELDAEYRHTVGRVELARAKLRTEAGSLRASLHPLQGSGSLPSMVGIDAYVVIPADRERIAAGEKLEAILVAPSHGSSESPFQ